MLKSRSMESTRFNRSRNQKGFEFSCFFSVVFGRNFLDFYPNYVAFWPLTLNYLLYGTLQIVKTILLIFFSETISSRIFSKGHILRSTGLKSKFNFLLVVLKYKYCSTYEIGKSVSLYIIIRVN